MLQIRSGGKMKQQDYLLNTLNIYILQTRRLSSDFADNAITIHEGNGPGTCCQSGRCLLLLPAMHQRSGRGMLGCESIDGLLVSVLHAFAGHIALSTDHMIRFGGAH